jgi:hypothetical protein
LDRKKKNLYVLVCVQDLGIKNGLHRKKLQLALQAMGGEKGNQLCDLDHNFVARMFSHLNFVHLSASFFAAL